MGKNWDCFDKTCTFSKKSLRMLKMGVEKNGKIRPPAHMCFSYETYII